MSDITENKIKLPADLPKCTCFDYPDEHVVMTRCVGVAQGCHMMVQVFNEISNQQGLCKTALPYFVEMAVVSLLTSAAKTQGPALSYGSQEIEWEVERLLQGLEARVLARSRDVYARARELGVTEETVKAMRERDAREGGLSS